MRRRTARRTVTAILVAIAGLAALLGGALVSGGVLSIVVTSGVSMNPVYYQGDMVIVGSAGSYEVGDIAAYRRPDKGFVVLHRIIGGDAINGFVFKGDNNRSPDPTHPTQDQLVGRAVLHLPQAGRCFQIFTSPAALAVAAFALTVFGGTTIRTRRRKRRATMAQRARPTGVPRKVLTMPRNLQFTAAVAGVLCLLGVALGAAAWTRSPEQMASSSSQASRQMNFSYTAEVPPSPAYDGTTVYSPEPVFRRLTNTVNVHLSYQGVPGTFSVHADLSTPSGWHSTVPLAPLVEFTGDKYQSDVTLDLNSLDGRAKAASDVTGLPAAPLTVAVVAAVQYDDGAQFTPKLTLQLEALKLSPSGDPTVTDSTIVHDTSQVPTTVGIGPWQISVIQARALSTIMLIAAALTTAALVMLARRAAPTTECAAIRRRYAPLLATVAPITTPADVKVVDVAEFITLAKLSERCGQLVLHWTRSNIETFVVLDEGTTYRYRTGTGPPTQAVTTPDEAGGAETIDSEDFTAFRTGSSPSPSPRHQH